MVEAGGDDFLIRKSTMIVKNKRNIDEVYEREKKVSYTISLLEVDLDDFDDSNLAKERMVRSAGQLTERRANAELSK